MRRKDDRGEGMSRNFADVKLFTRRYTSKALGLVKPRVFLLGILGALSAALLIIVIMALMGEYTNTRGRLILTTLTLAAFCLSAVSPAALHRQGRYQPAALAALMASALGLSMVTVGIWATPDSDAFWKATAIASILSAATFHGSVLLLWQPGPGYVGLIRWPGVIAALAAALMAILGIVFEIKLGVFWWAMVLLILGTVWVGLAAGAHRLGRALAPVRGSAGN